MPSIAMAMLYGCTAFADVVRVDAFAKANAEDDTAAFQSAIDSGADMVVVPNRGRPWTVRPVFGRSNLKLVFERGAVVEAKRGEYRPRKDCMFRFDCCTNVTVSGYGATLRMHKWDYLTDAYVKSQFRHILKFDSCANVTVEGLRLMESGGDGIVFGVNYDRDPQRANFNIVIRDVVSDGNNRQGISIISAENLLIENCDLLNTYGTDPSSGIDFEPNTSGDRMVNCRMKNCRIRNNMGSGIEIYLVNLNADSRPVSMIFDGCETYNNSEEILLNDSSKFYWTSRAAPHGTISIRNCTFRNTRTDFIKSAHELGRGIKLEIEGCKFIDDPFPDRKSLNVATEVFDDAPGQMKSVPEMPLLCKASYAVCVDRPRTVNIKAKLDAIRALDKDRWGRVVNPEILRSYAVLNGEGTKVGEFSLPETSGTVEWRFDAPAAGVYTFGGYAHRVLSVTGSDAPIAIDVTGLGCYLMRAIGDLYAYVPPNAKRLEVVANGMGRVDRMNLAIYDPSGRMRASRGAIERSERFSYETPQSGLWRLELRKPVAGKHSGYGLDVHGALGYLFLDNRRTWR